LTAAAGLTWAQLLRRPELTIGQVLEAIKDQLKSDPLLEEFEHAVQERGADEARQISAVSSGDAGGEAIERAARRNEARAVETEIKFAGYLDQQRKAIERLKAAEAVTIPEWIEYGAISGLSREMREKLEQVRPATIGQASRIPGVTPAALSLVHVSIRLQGRMTGAKRAAG
jgi:tRNA uridine 5-carboxymethylaminomethyl modification enzyme